MDTTTNTSTNSTATFSCSTRRQGLCEIFPIVAEMPIASGAAGRVDAGVDANTAWTAAGLRKKINHSNMNHDSYLARYLELRNKQAHKTDLLQIKEDNTDPCHDKYDGEDSFKEVKEEIPQKNASGGVQASGKLPSGARSKKSQLCVIL